MIKDLKNDPIASPEDDAPERRKKQRAGRTIITFFIIYALGAFSLYLFIVFFGSIASTQ
ncbi:hypothetical protein [Rhizobium sp. SL86]|jgi:hypothetical protein|uniref:hypothetical protein n=1 Tax=Rhizobium sp. SL86 TaxID=2995148 RepID=UPI002274F283|nr:hypothetical protein [Rhizobium sp. SL86]MCY1665899.1 hypothetical protein [Rhizobium sp. SL86]